jgi:fatty-acyl-CoA synthase
MPDHSPISWLASQPTLWQLLDAQAAQRGDAPALRFEGQSTRYAALAEQAQSMAADLAARGVAAGDRVAYLGFNHPLQIALLFACARIGALLVPLNWRLAQAEWQAVMQDCSPRLIVSDVVWAEQAASIASLMHRPRQYLLLEDLLQTPMKASAMTSAQGTASSAALLVYTSGTTGLPKGAVHTQHNLLQNMAIAGINAALIATDLIASMLPLFHVGGLCIQTLPALQAGACVSLQARFEPAQALQCFQQERPTLTLQVPATMRALIEHPLWASTDVSSLRAVWAGSSILPAHLIEAFHARGLPVCNVYGSTETGPFSICLPPEKAMSHQGSCGWPARTTDAQVEVMLAGHKDGKDDIGELCIRAPNVAERYWPDQPLKDAQGFFHTGDLARRAADGSYTVIGRVKDMLISGGENIYPAEIENLLAAHPAVAECAVVGLPDAQWGEVVAACVVLAPHKMHAAADVQSELTALLAAQLARYKQPKHWFFLPQLPKTALGKVQKAVLKLQLTQQRDEPLENAHR